MCDQRVIRVKVNVPEYRCVKMCSVKGQLIKLSDSREDEVSVSREYVVLCW